MAEASKLRPARLSHFGIQTYDVVKIRDWYCSVLNAHVVFEKLPMFCVIAFDEEHHRVAIAALTGAPRGKYRANPEIMHVAFAMDDVFSFLENYERIRDLGIVPEVNLNHGPSVSSYYRDPDGNQCELFVDRFATQQACREWMFSPVYEHNFGAGVYFDPEDLLAKMRSGASEAELLHYPVEAGMAVDIAGVAKEMASAYEEETRRFDAEVVASRTT